MAARAEDVMALKRLSIDPMEDDDDDEFEPLYNYSRTVVPVPTFLSDDSDDEDLVTASAPKRRPEIAPAKELSTRTPQKAPVKKIVLDDDDDDDSWLISSSPKLPKMPQPAFSTGNLALQQLRERRKELMMLQQLASPGAIKNIEELARIQAQQRPEVEPPPKVLESHVEPPKSEVGASEEKEKVLIKVQDKFGNSQSIRIYATDKFEKLFAQYARMVKASLPNLSFRFDGDQLAPNSTPKEHDMEDEDIIEVYDKSSSS
ncbi:hypothetical protein M758_6G058500 [Ceratodon purpureus]|nr:hypothetical protein M758_6G058500 [Ceratodon purpureus]